ncbi:MAG: hypothetical protein KJZ91_25995 [Myxococcales bacterium]|nr:hypothetical protein [Myxococcales bacterium]
MRRRHLLALVLVALVACGGSGDDGGGGGDGDGGGSGDGGGGGGDGGGPDAAPPLPVCVPTCGTAADCATGPAGSIIDADNYACDGGRCRWLGCRSTAECVATYGTQAWTCEAAFGAAVPTCWPTCTGVAQCANPQSPLLDADNYACDGGKCRWTGCNSTAECTAANMSQAWACRDVGGLMTCVRTCSTPADCASPSAPYDADNYACVAGACEWRGCNTTAECMTIDPDWVCE